MTSSIVRWATSYAREAEGDTELEMVSDSESQELVNQFAIEKFGADYQLIQAERKTNQEQDLLYRKFGYGSFGASLLSSGMLIGFKVAERMIPTTIFCGLSIATTLAAAAFYFKVQSLEDFDQKEDLILQTCNSLAALSSEFEHFKRQPAEDKTNLKYLFDCLRDLTYLKTVTISKTLTPDEIELLTSSSRVFLMDAIAEILKEKQVDSILPEEWESCLKTMENRVVNDVIGHIPEDPWKRLDICPPLPIAYKHFFAYKKQMDSLRIADEMITIFNKVVKDPEALKVNYWCCTRK